jgi:gamma-glutamyltranspeptidase/glutathione hydrolase
MGGFMQPQGHLQVIVAIIDDELDPQAALDRTRFCLPNGQADDPIALEEGIPAEEGKKLEEMGHKIQVICGYGRALFGRGQIIQKGTDSGILIGGSDPRADGTVGVLI